MSLKGNVHSHEHSHYHIHTNEFKTRVAVLLTLVTMCFELFYGYTSHSVALITEGWHMLSHVLVLFLSWLTYFYLKKSKNKYQNVSESRILSLGGFASAIVLLFISFHILVEAIQKFNGGESHVHGAVLLTAVIGLLVNGISAFVLHQEEEKQDVNLQGAFFHVLSDVVISVLAILSLSLSYFCNFHAADPYLGFIGCAFMFYWSLSLLLKTIPSILNVK